jgi:hypothetical protein
MDFGSKSSLTSASLRGTDIEKARCWPRDLKLGRRRIKLEFVLRHFRGTCVPTLIGLRLTRARCRDAVTDLEEAIVSCHRIALLKLIIGTPRTRVPIVGKPRFLLRLR